MKQFRRDLQAVMDRDPAATSKFIVFFTYGGFRAIRRHRRANWFYRHKMKGIAELISAKTRRVTGVDIHPAAKIGQGVFIDHGVGVVIGETCEIGDNVTIYQGVTLGGTGKDVGKRHPTIGNNCMISSGAKVLGPITIGECSKIGAGSVVLKDVPSHSTVVGVPGRIVKRHETKIDLNQNVPDPVLQEFARVCKRLAVLEEKLGIESCKYSIANTEIIEDEAYLQSCMQKRQNDKQSADEATK